MGHLINGDQSMPNSAICGIRKNGSTTWIGGGAFEVQRRRPGLFGTPGQL